MSSMQNHLANAASLYLRQHANNPVDWYPWGEEALTLAKQADKPILLSIGYSACHWCHVMAHESFENPATAFLMNQWFINIKVDREERPDLDKIYQTSYQLLMGRGGGWPLTIFLTPEDLVPFFAGTYFPLTEHHGVPAFTDVLRGIHNYFRAHRDEIQQQNRQLRGLLSEVMQPSGPSTLLTTFDAHIFTKIFTKVCQILAENFDPQHGGFGGAPKFPQPICLAFLLDYALRQPANTEHKTVDQAKQMVKLSLEKMAKSGLYDHLGGGFFRYSVDAAWQIPHFEKMLYDNAQLLALYAVTKQPTIAISMAEWVSQEMQASAGGYYATLDADSDGHEGRFYYWSREELQALLTPAEYKLIATYLGVSEPPNFEGHWHLRITHDLPREQQALYQSARQKLLTARAKRPKPGRDEKIIFSWNGLMIKAMALAGRYLNQPQFIESAQCAIDAIYQSSWRADQQVLYHTSAAPVFLDDYVFLLEGLIELLQSKWRSSDLQFAIGLAEAILTHFANREKGGFYFTSHQHEALIERPKTLIDESIPASNGIAAQALARLGFLLGKTEYLAASEYTLKMAWLTLQQTPHLYLSLLLALQDYLVPPQIIILRGSASELALWQQYCQADYQPKRLVFAIPNDTTGLPENLASKSAGRKICAYVCEGLTCHAVIDDIDTFKTMLK